MLNSDCALFTEKNIVFYEKAPLPNLVSKMSFLGSLRMKFLKHFGLHPPCLLLNVIKTRFLFKNSHFGNI
jgi:hypothetical protein